MISSFKLLILFCAFIPFSVSQTNVAPPSVVDSCNGVFVSYVYGTGSKLKPTNKTHQAYRFESTLTVLNNGDKALKSWRVFVGFKHDELLVSASNAVLVDGNSFPASVFLMSDLKTAIETAGDVIQMQVQVKLLGTQFGVAAVECN